jgi:hypothetical protein
MTGITITQQISLYYFFPESTQSHAEKRGRFLFLRHLGYLGLYLINFLSVFL